jgi:hypothetical protein
METNTEVNKTQETQTEEKTFTQAELNAIVQKRLGEEKARYENYEELKAKAVELGVEGPCTSWRHMVGWNTLGLPLMGPAVATQRFFSTLNRVEKELNRRQT